MEHTQGTWRVTGNGTIRYIDVSVGNGMAQEVATCMRTEYGDMEANARRIVACVNACSGISTENLEQNNPIAEGLRNLNQLLRTAEAQRDALLVALESLVDMDVAYQRGEKVELAVEAARAAIQQVRSKE